MADYNSSYTGSQIDTAVGRSLNPDSTPTADSNSLVSSGGVTSAVSAVQNTVSRRNLLDNPWFTVNQRGQNSYTGNAYTVDRWRFQNNSGTCSVVSGGITFSNSASGYGYFTQILDFTMDGAKTYTLSVIADGQVYSAQSGDNITLASGLLIYFANSSQISIRVPGSLNSSEVISAVKLELGSVSTLANDAPPNYAEELAKCQRFYWNANLSSTNLGIFGGVAGSQGGSFSLTIPTPVPMRAVTPTITAGVQFVRGNGSSITGYTLSTANAAVMNGFIYGIALDKSSGYTAYQSYYAALNELKVSCDL